MPVAKDSGSLVECLYDEVLGEMAQNFFGTRKEIDDDLERFGIFLGQLKERLASLQAAGDAFRGLFPDDAAAEACFSLLCDRPDVLVRQFKPDPTELARLDVPFSLTRRGRYRRLAMTAYRHLRSALDAYLNGVHEPLPDNPRCLRLSVNYKGLRRYAELVNERIRAANDYQNPSGALMAVKGLDPLARERESVTGGILEGYVDRLDDDMKYERIDFTATDLPDLPDLPPPDEARERLDVFFRSLYDNQSAEIHTILDRVQAHAEKTEHPHDRS